MQFTRDVRVGGELGKGWVGLGKGRIFRCVDGYKSTLNKRKDNGKPQRKRRYAS